MWNAPFAPSSLLQNSGLSLKRRPSITRAHSWSPRTQLFPSQPFVPQATKNLMRRLILPCTLLLLAAALPVPSWCQQHSVDEDGRPLSAVFGPKEQLGAWFQPPLPEEANRMQAVHIALLPS